MAYLNGSLYFAGLRGESLYQAVLDPTGKTVLAFGPVGEITGKFGRLRDVVADEANGILYVTTSNRDGRARSPFPLEGDDKVIAFL